MAVRITHLETGVHMELPFSREEFLKASREDGSEEWDENEFSIEDLEDE
jgi:hypothetical protein